MAELGADIPKFIENGFFDARVGFAVQFRAAHGLVELMNPGKVTPENFRPIMGALTMGMSVREEPHGNQQELLIRDATKRLVGMVALIVSGGNPQKADSLLGDNQELGSVYNLNGPDFDFVKAVQDGLKNLKNPQ